MAGGALARDQLKPHGPGGQWQGVLLSVLVHAGLIAVLLLGFRWQAPAPTAATAELWAAAPQVAPPPPQVEPRPTPRAVEPPPKPLPSTQQPEAEIALEKARKAQLEKERQDRQEQERQAKDLRERKEKAEKAEKEKADREKAERALKAEKAEKAAKEERDAKARLEAQRREQAAADKELARQREENLARMMGQLGNSGPSGSGSDARGSASASGGGGGPSASYAGRVVAAIKPNIVFSETLPGNPAAEVEVRTGPGGTIIGSTLVKGSGRAEWDSAVLRAIERTGSLPKDTDGRVPPKLVITFRPKD